jgi:glycerol-3-phosphate acyltransferase PlsY
MLTFVENISIIIAYLMGSIPTAVWVSKYFYKVDIRDYGSGNAGTTNTLRTLGKWPGLFVLAIDVLKGFGAVHVAYLFSHYKLESDAFINFQFVLGISALVGHIFPVFAQFKGGKGIATIFGVLLGMNIVLSICLIAVFVIILSLSKYVSLSSIIAAIALPLLGFLAFKHNDQILFRFFAIGTAFLVIVTHQKNILRLVSGTESKFSISKNKKS